MAPFIIQMKIRMISMAFTQQGMFEPPAILSTDRNESTDRKAYHPDFLNHLVDQANAAERLDYETKIDPEYETQKKPQENSTGLSTQSLPQGKALPSKTRGRRGRTQ